MRLRPLRPWRRWLPPALPPAAPRSERSESHQAAGAAPTVVSGPGVFTPRWLPCPPGARAPQPAAPCGRSARRCR
eukprot:5144135-Lingulodinium_polyedra.AAC.1